jgi:filamentous hemagglutinin
LIDIQAGTINAAKDLNLSSSGDINLKNLGLAAENSVSRVKNINAYSGQNLNGIIQISLYLKLRGRFS